MIPADSSFVERLLSQGSFTLKNAVVSGAIILAIGGMVVAYLRNIPRMLWGWFLRRFTISVEVINSDVAFAWVQTWLDSQPYTKKSRQLSARAQYLVDTDSLGPIGSSAEKQYVTLMPAPGNHFFYYKRRPVWLSFVREHDSGSSGGTLVPRETIQIRTVARSQDVIRTLLLEAREMAVNRNRTEPRVFVAVYNSWRNAGLLHARPVDSVILPDNAVTRVVEDCRTFMASASWYAARGIPYRRGWLFHGKAGTGKSSLVEAVAGALSRSLYVINLASVERDAYLMELLMAVPPSSLILFEDIDTAMRTRADDQKTEDEGVTLGGLLNALDGVVAHQGSLVFMTSNYKSRLDAALIRPGRIDARLEFDVATPDQMQAAFTRFYGVDKGALDFVANMNRARPPVMCEVQEHLLRHRDNPQAAIALAATIGEESAV